MNKTCNDIGALRETLLAEYHSLETAEDRLIWISEREALHLPFPLERATPEARVPGCMSGLWLESETQQGDLYFTAHSDSSMVGGIASLLCDIYSGLSAEQILALGEKPIKELKLESLITPTRRNAIQKVYNFFLFCARKSEPQT